MNVTAPVGTVRVEHVMGMVVSIDVRDLITSPVAAAIEAVVAWLHDVDSRFSTYRNDSEISRFGLGDIGIDELSVDAEEVLRRCIELTDVTGGTFDAFAVPAPNGTDLDPSGLVKGWSVERAAGILESGGASNFCINAGGDIAVRGTSQPGQPWRIGIRHPDHVDQLALVLALTGPVAVATSATYERGAHIIDPATGEPTADIASATVVGPDLGTADAFATAVFVMGEAGVDWIEDQPGYDAYVISHDGVTRWSRDFPHPSLNPTWREA